MVACLRGVLPPMVGRGAAGLVLAGLLLAGLVGIVPAARAGAIEPSTDAVIGAVTRAPSGWLQFCRDWPVECPDIDLPSRDIAISAASWQAIDGVNRATNREIRSVTDAEHYGRTEYWTYPQDGKGDCEDFLLLKRRRLIDLGYPRQALLVTVVANERNEGHAVLTVRTDRGEYVLDNLRKDILPWSRTGYRFVKRQSQRNPTVWVSLGDDAPAAVAAAR